MLSILAYGIFVYSSGLFAADMKGASSILEQVKSAIDSGKEIENPIMSKRHSLARDMEQFGKMKGSMTNLEAANQWVSLAVRFLQLPQFDPRQIKAKNLEEFKLFLKTTTIKSLFEIIPGPDSWSGIATLCKEKLGGEKANPQGLKSILMFINLLTHNIDQVLSDIEYFETSALEGDPYNKESVRLWFSQMKDKIKKLDPSQQASTAGEAFDLVVNSFETFVTQPAIVRAPDLLKEVGREKATQLMKRALSTSTIYLEIPSGAETRKLGVEIALSEIDTLKRPQWGLIHSMGTTELFEKLYDKFVRSKTGIDQDYAQMVQSRSKAIPFEGENELLKRAISYYVLGLLSKNKFNEAIEFTLSIKDDLISASEFGSSLEATERTDIFRIYTKFLDTLLRNNPELSFWKQYVKISLISHKEDVLQDTLSTVLLRNDIDFLLRQKLKKHFITVLLAQNKIEKAHDVFKEIATTETIGQKRKTRHEFANLRYGLGRNLYRLGKVLERRDLKDQGTMMAMTAYQNLLDSEDSRSIHLSIYKLGEIVSILTDREEFGKAEQLIIETSLQHIKNSRKGNQYPLDVNKYTLPDVFVELAKLYGKAGLHHEVIALLDLSPWWNAEDLSDLHDQDLALVTARALHTAGDIGKATDILKSYLLEKSNDDEAYQLLIEIAGNDIISWLDKLYRMDRFEERPLIWKAYLLYKAGKIDDAEKVIRQAMNVDPTDGEQKAGQRVHSYNLLADILDAKGDKENATFFRKVVKSVRIAEKGDLISEAGLVTRSIDYYQEAMGVFADAYCIQWRLAERLYATGDLEGSKEHYRVAFERMPEQFGQVASFCFGCEGAFDKMQSRSAAEEVFSHLLETTPDRPQLHFLYGLLRKSQKRIPEAFRHFKKAVELDEDYLDAWKEISLLSDSVYLSRQEEDRIVIKMLSLDPQQRHFSANISDVGDWVSLWNTIEKNQKFIMKSPKSLYPFRESTKMLKAEREKEAKNNNPDFYYMQMNRDFANRKTMNPSELLSQHNMIPMLDYFISLDKKP